MAPAPRPRFGYDRPANFGNWSGRFGVGIRCDDRSNCSNGVNRPGSARPGSPLSSSARLYSARLGWLHSARGSRTGATSRPESAAAAPSSALSLAHSHHTHSSSSSTHSTVVQCSRSVSCRLRNAPHEASTWYRAGELLSAMWIQSDRTNRKLQWWFYNTAVNFKYFIDSTWLC